MHKKDKNKNSKRNTIKSKQTSEKLKFDRTLSKVIVGVVILAVVLLVYAIVGFGALPLRYRVIASLLLILLAVVLGRWLVKSRRNTSKIVSLMIVVALLFGVTQVSVLRNFIGRVTGSSTEHNLVHVVVMEASPHESMRDFKDLNPSFGSTSLADSNFINQAQEEIKTKDKIEFNAVSFTDYIEMTDALYDGSVDALIISEGHGAFIEEIKENFSEETRIIATYSYEKEVELPPREVDVSSETFSIFITGIDTYGKLSSVSRSDVNMVMTVNPTTHQILLTSIPRDYHVTLHSFGVKDKLTHAGIYGVMESVKTLEDLLSSQAGEKIDIDYYLRVNFTSVVDIVNALGGVSVNSIYSFRAGGHTFNKGMNDINGAQALSFVRERYSLPGGDFDRIKNQQALISGIIDKATSPTIITRYNKFLSSVAGSFELSMPEKEFNKVVNDQISSMKGWEIISIQLGATGAHSKTTYSMPGWNLYVAEPKYDTVKSAAEMILKMESGLKVSKETDWPH